MFLTAFVRKLSHCSVPGPIFLAACQSEDGVILLKPIMDGVGKEDAHSLSLTETGVEHLEAAGPLQGVAIRRCQSRCCKVGGVGAVSLPPVRRCQLGTRKNEKEGTSLGFRLSCCITLS